MVVGLMKMGVFLESICVLRVDSQAARQEGAWGGLSHELWILVCIYV